jgi:putative MATE family efflux protein
VAHLAFKTGDGDLTRGSIPRQLAAFALPLMLGNLLQQLYNAVDAVIVGHFVGRDALAAVGCAGPVVNLLVSFFMGLSSGGSVLISRHFGARDQGRLNAAVHTSMLMSGVVGAALSLAGVLLAPSILRAINTPQEMFAGADAYLRIYFAGLPALTVYNMGSAVLTAVGNARYPLYFLLTSTVLNTVGDLVLITRFRMGVAGAALATIIAEGVSAALVVAVLCRTHHDYRLFPRGLRLEPEALRGIVKIGMPGAVQGSIVSVSNVIVMSYLNGLGSVAVAGYSAANKLDAFLPLPVAAMALAAPTFVGQNLGAGQVARARRGTRVAMLMGIGVTIPLSALALAFHNSFLGLFSTDAEVLDYGWQFMRVFAPFYFVLAGTQILPGALRGAGDVTTATLANVGCFVVLRQIYLSIVTKVDYSVLTVALGYPVTWALCAAIIAFRYLRSDWRPFEKPASPPSAPPP